MSGRYQQGALLGTGGVGEVRAGRDLRLGREVAIKRLRPELAQVRGNRQRFEREARMAARLVHPNIVSVFDFGIEDGIPFLVMERLSGKTLADVIAGGPLGFGEARQLGGQVLDAVSAAHAAGMIHRDIKPRNVLVAETGCWKVGDFGIAKSIDGDADPALTATGLVVGTPAYLAPERLMGSPATTACDIYSVGVLLYQALTGELSAVLRPLSEVRPEIPPSLANVVTRAMSRDPADRFASAAEMADALRAVPPDEVETLAGGVPLGATEVMVAPARVVRGHRRVALVVGAVALVLAMSLVVLVSGGTRSAPADTATTPTTVSTTATAPTTAVTTPAAPAAPAPAPAGITTASDHGDKGKKKKK